MPDLLSKQEARAMGLKRYFMAVECRRGHVDERLVSNNQCLVCHRLLGRGYRSSPEDNCRRQKIWQARWPEKVKAKQRAYAPRQRVRRRERYRKAMAALRALEELGIEI